MKMEDREKILTLLGDTPQDAGELSRKLGISRKTLFSLLMEMEKEDMIAWDGQEWVITPSAAPQRSNTPPSKSGGGRPGDWA